MHRLRFRNPPIFSSPGGDNDDAFSYVGATGADIATLIPHMQMAMRSNLIAVVDDDVSHAKALARLLETLNYRAEVFESAADFMRGFSKIDPYCLLVDVDLGTSSGLDLARELSASGFEVPIIFMTGSQDHTVYRQCVDLGCIGFLRKPIPERQLTDAIANVSRIAA